MIVIKGTRTTLSLQFRMDNSRIRPSAAGAVREASETWQPWTGRASASANAFVRAAIAESRGRLLQSPKAGTICSETVTVELDTFRDLDDFIVCQEGRDYQHLFSKHFKYCAGAATL